MKKIISLFLALSIISFLMAQKGKDKQPQPIATAFTVPTNKYIETFDGNDSKYGWSLNAN